MMELTSPLHLAALALSAGVLAFFNPCSYAALPAYISYVLGRDVKRRRKSSVRSALEGAGFGAAATLGFISVFTAVGAIVSLVGEAIKPLYQWVLVIGGAVLIALGVLWLAGAQLQLPRLSPGGLTATHLSFYAFGVVYALAAIACVLPVFLMIVFTALSAGGFLGGVLVFLMYALGMGTMMIMVSVAAALSRELLLRRSQTVMSYVHRASAVILMVAGAYMILYWYMTFGV